MTNKKLILGIAAGVAALAVVGIICNKKGYINFGSMLDKAGDMAGKVKDTLGKIKDSAVAEADSVIQESKNIAGKAINAAAGVNDKASNAVS
ncbi:MAG: hypothetical protein JNM71_13570 [Flavobacterium lindanitolerans]|jgi:uncharacterized protein YjbJ (UPF0337 family)|uniref:hypothetical protein n=1 Tax=Flavobacterium TaxID=237 RepID=UPI0006FF8554|nr:MULTISPECIES: hypothetical protein [Flavobacterium]KQS47661.1 hypothetical protein ASG38_09480 [Flavobacterium sp. Leaf359]MBL7869039.1 hypothetical protein [Flavobacterium lindanitolerans]PZO33155.1 MAG: hypothetical protein DCE86_05615 [Flavobacteriaceae bacterium]PZQ92150.1 MAG: hypothetical protein DI548_01580 [Flavobacterium johnsoniae]